MNLQAWNQSVVEFQLDRWAMACWRSEGAGVAECGRVYARNVRAAAGRDWFGIVERSMDLGFFVFCSAWVLVTFCVLLFGGVFNG